VDTVAASVQSGAAALIRGPQRGSRDGDPVLDLTRGAAGSDRKD
jgi:hypothetical protein